MEALEHSIGLHSDVSVMLDNNLVTRTDMILHRLGKERCNMMSASVSVTSFLVPVSPTVMKHC